MLKFIDLEELLALCLNPECLLQLVVMTCSSVSHRAGPATKRPLQLQRAPWPAEGPLESLLASWRF